MNLPRTFLMSFELTREPFLIHRGRFYSLERPNCLDLEENCSNEDYLMVQGRKFPLERSAKLSQIEEQYFRSHSDKIVKRMESIIQEEFIDKLEKSEKALFKQKNIYEQNRVSQIDLFIRQLLIPKYKQMINRYWGDEHQIKDSKIPEVKIKGEKFAKDKFKNPGITDLCLKKSSLEEMLKSESLYMMASRCYRLQAQKTGNLEEYIMIGFSRQKLVPYCDIETLEENYKKAISSKIIQVARKHGRILLPKIKHNEQEMKKIDDSKKYKNEREFGSIGYIPTNNQTYRLYLKFKPYIIEREKSFYKFPGVAVGTDLRITNEGLVVTSLPLVLENNRYHHPFVFKDNSICYSSDKLRWKNLGFKVGVEYPLSSLQHASQTAWRIAAVLCESWKVIHKGYLDGIVPVNNIPQDFTSYNIDRDQANRSGLIIHKNG